MSNIKFLIDLDNEGELTDYDLDSLEDLLETSLENKFSNEIVEEFHNQVEGTIEIINAEEHDTAVIRCTLNEAMNIISWTMDFMDKYPNKLKKNRNEYTEFCNEVTRGIKLMMLDLCIKED